MLYRLLGLSIPVIMPCLICIFCTFWGTWNRPKEEPGESFRRMAVIFLIITNREIQLPGLQLSRIIGQVSLVGSMNDRHNCRSGRKLMFHIPLPVTHVHCAGYLATFRVCKVHRFNNMVCLKWEMCQKWLNTFENIPEV